MEFVKLEEKEFKKFAYNHEQASFHQTIGWGKLKEENGWTCEFLGLKEDNEVKAATMLLSKMTPIKKKMFYAPHGFLLDYKDTKLFDKFLDKVKKHVKENKGIFLKIDPYLMKVQRDINGDIVENGIDNRDVHKYLLEKGFKEINGKRTEQTLQGKWIYWIDIKGRTLDEVMKDMTSKTRQMIRKNEKNGIEVKEAGPEALPKFKDIMDHTSERREFLSRSLDYYKQMYDNLNKEDICKIYFAELNLKEQIKKFEDERETLQNDYDKKEKDFSEGKLKVNEKKFQAKQNETLEAIKRLDKSIDEYKELRKKEGQDILILGGIMYMIHGKEVISFIGGAYSKYLDFQPFYTLHYEMLKYAVENNYERYNFYGISGNLKEDDPMYGIYLFKKGFGGEVVELMGEFDYPISKTYYCVYKTSYGVYHKLKQIKKKLPRKNSK